MRSLNRLLPVVTTCIFTLVYAGTASATTTTKSKHTASSSLHKTSSHTSTSHSAKHSSKSKTKTASKKSHGQHAIDEERTREIQTALIREHYLSGEPTGSWDQSTKDAMTRYQAENGWQTKLTPDSRALIKLGLGPDHKGLLNPETAVIPAPHELGIDNQAQPGGSANNQK